MTVQTAAAVATPQWMAQRAIGLSDNLLCDTVAIDTADQFLQRIAGGSGPDRTARQLAKACLEARASTLSNPSPMYYRSVQSVVLHTLATGIQNAPACLALAYAGTRLLDYRGRVAHDDSREDAQSAAALTTSLLQSIQRTAAREAPQAALLATATLTASGAVVRRDSVYDILPLHQNAFAEILDQYPDFVPPGEPVPQQP